VQGVFGRIRSALCGISSYLHLMQLEGSNSSIYSSRTKSGPSRIPYRLLESILMFSVGAIFSFYLICNSEFDGRHFGWWFLLLMGCFLLMAYGTYLFLDSKEASADSLFQRPQLSQDALDSQSQLRGAIHFASLWGTVFRNELGESLLHSVIWRFLKPVERGSIIVGNKPKEFSTPQDGEGPRTIVSDYPRLNMIDRLRWGTYEGSGRARNGVGDSGFQDILRRRPVSRHHKPEGISSDVNVKEKTDYPYICDFQISIIGYHYRGNLIP
jgi:hypothetical protein